MSAEEDRQRIQEAVAAWADAHVAITVALARCADPMGQFQAASSIADQARSFADSMAGERARYAMAIRKAERLGYRRLGDRLGVSEARARQLVQAAKGR